MSKLMELLNSTIFSKRFIAFIGLFIVLLTSIHYKRYVILYCLFTFSGMKEFISMARLQSTSIIGSLAILSAYLYNIVLAISVALVVYQDLHLVLPNKTAEEMFRIDIYKYTMGYVVCQIALLFAREMSVRMNPTNVVPSLKVLLLVAAGAIWCPGLTFFAALIATHSGIYFLAFLFITTGLQDNWQLMFGKLFGRYRPFPYLSPKKSIEGYIGGTVMTVVTIWYMQRYFSHDMRLAPVVVVLGILGDLSMSAVKRALELKDTGDVLPGMGGLLDRMDSQLFILPAAYCLMLYK